MYLHEHVGYSLGQIMYENKIRERSYLLWFQLSWFQITRGIGEPIPSWRMRMSCVASPLQYKNSHMYCILLCFSSTTPLVWLTPPPNIKQETRSSYSHHSHAWLGLWSTSPYDVHVCNPTPHMRLHRVTLHASHPIFEEPMMTEMVCNNLSRRRSSACQVEVFYVLRMLGETRHRLWQVDNSRRR